MSMSPQQPSAPRGNSAPANAAPKLTISRGVKAQPEWIVIYGSPKIGKSTMASSAPNAVFLDLEDGTAQIDCARIEGINTWDGLLATMRALVADPQGFETVVIDTLDKAEWLCWMKVCANGGKNGTAVKSLEDVGGGFGKGYTAAYEEFRRFIACLQDLRKRGLRAIILAHAKVAKVPNTDGGPDFERWDLKVDKRVSGILFEAADAVLYAHRDVAVAKKDGQRATGFSDGRRLLATSETTAYVAGNRFGLPPVIELSWDVLADGIGKGNSPDLLIATIRQRAAKLSDPEKRERIEKAIAQHASNYPKLLDINNWLAANPDPITAESVKPSTDNASVPSTSATTEPSE